MFKNAKFIKGVVGGDEILKSDFKQIAFYGRSNVGKSSVINSILNNKNLVRSSSKPGKTTEINFFEAEFLENGQKYFFVDLPGYGYAKMSKLGRERLRKMILWYLLETNIKNRLNILVLDIRRGFTEFDKQILEIFKTLKLELANEYLIILNKSDKLNQKEKSKIEKEMRELGENHIFFSAVKNKGREKFYEFLK